MLHFFSKLSTHWLNSLIILSMLGQMILPIPAVAAAIERGERPERVQSFQVDEPTPLPLEEGPTPTPVVATPGATNSPSPVSGEEERTPWRIYLPQIFKNIAGETEAGPEAGETALVSVLIEPGQLYAGGRGTVLIFVSDAAGQPVKDGTVVTVKTSGGVLSGMAAETKEGLIRLSLTAGGGIGEKVITAEAGGIQGEAVFTIKELEGVEIGEGESPSFDPKSVIEQVRNPLRATEDGGWNAENEGYIADFTAGGFAFRLKGDERVAPGEMRSSSGNAPIEFAFQLMGIRRGEQIVYTRGAAEVALPQTAYNEITWQRSAGIAEGYRARTHGLQQLFTLETPPPGEGDLVIRGQFLTALSPKYVSDEEGISFYPPETSPAEREMSEGILRYTGAIVRDAEGRETFAGLSLQGLEVELRVPGKWLEEVAYPVSIDPMIGDPALVSDPRDAQAQPAIAYNGDDNEYLVMWSGYDTGGASADIEGQRVSANGDLIGELMVIASAEGEQKQPAVSYNSVRSEYLVVWADYRADADGDIYGQRILADGTLAGENYPVVATGVLQDTPDLVYNPDEDEYLMVWRDRRGSSVYVYGHLLSGSGSLTGTELVIFNGGGDNQQPRTAYNRYSGEYLVVWSKWNSNILGKRVSSAGALLDNPGTTANEAIATQAFDICTASGSQYEPVVAANPLNGSYLIVWRDTRNGNSDVFGRVVAGNGSLSGTELAVSDTSSALQGRPDVTFSEEEQAWLITWRDDRTDADIYGQLVGSAGMASGNNFVVYAGESTQDYPRGMPDAVNNGYVTIWVDWRETTGNTFGRQVTAGGATPNVSFPVSPVTGQRIYPGATFNGYTEEYLLVWEDYRAGDADVYGQRLTKEGAAIGDNFLISDAGAAGNQTGPRVASAGANGYLVVWKDQRIDSDGDIYGQRVDANGLLQGNNILLAGTNEAQKSPTPAYNPEEGCYLVVWCDMRSDAGGDIYGQLVRSDGVISGSNMAVGASPSRTQDGPDLVYNEASGEFLAVWRQWTSTGNYDIYGQQLSGQGDLLDNPGTAGDESDPAVAFPITTEGSYQVTPRVGVERAGGRYLVVWEDERNYSGNNKDIYGQLIEPNGVLSGGNLIVSSGSNLERIPAVAGLDNGSGFVVAWERQRDASEKRDLYVKRLSATGETEEAGFSAKNDDVGWMVGMSVAASTGRPEVLLAWEEGSQIYASRYSILTAGFETDRRIGSAPLTVNFTNTSIPANEVATYEWDFGDGTTGAAITPTHIYTQAGVYTVSLTVTGAEGSNTLSKPAHIIVNSPFSPQADLAGYWRLDELGGARYDLSGHGNDLQAVNGAGWVEPGYIGNALDLERDSQMYLSANETLQNSLGITGSLTVMGWVKPESSSSDYMILASKYQGFGTGQYENAGYRLELYNDNHLGLMASPDGTVYSAYEVKGNTVLQNGEWYHVAGVFDAQAKELRLYVNGRADGSKPVAFEQLHLSTAPFMLGANLGGGGSAGQYLDGQMDEWRVYNRALSASEVETVMKLPGASFTATPSQGFAPLQVTFSNLSTNTTTCEWDFGDGSPVSAAETPIHSYSIPGVYTVTLKASNGAVTDTARRQIRATGVDEGLQAYWRLDEQSGVRYDSSPNGNHLSDNNTVGYQTGQVGLAADLENGNYESLTTDQAVQTGLAITGSLSVAGWFRLESKNDYQRLIAKARYNATPGDVGFYLYMNSDEHLYFVVSSDGGMRSYLSSGVAPAVGQWYYVAGVFDRERRQMRLYLNGELDAVRSVGFDTMHVSSAPLILGGWATTSNTVINLFDGLLDEWRVYSRALSRSEIQALMNLNPPAADFSAAPLTGTAPLTVTFVNSTTGATDYLWDFGDGITATVISPTHIYTQVGVYTVSLAASGRGGSDILTHTGYISVTGTTPITRAWQLITTTVTVPVIGEQAMAYDGGREVVVLYGGNADGWPYEDTTWEFDGTDWITVTTTQNPEARYGAAMGYDPVSQTMVLFGGSNSDDTALNQTWVYTAGEWIDATAAVSPLSRTNAAMTANPATGEMYLFGGNDGETYFNDLWKYAAGNWQTVPVSGTVPAARTLAATAWNSADDTLLLFGGRSVTGDPLADLWAFDPVSSEWLELDDGGGGGGPSARMAHSLTYDPDAGDLILVGGAADGDTLLADTWRYRGGWAEVADTALPPEAYHRMVYDSTAHALILVGNGEVGLYE